MSKILNYVKNSIGITGEYQDETLSNYINDICSFMIDAGVDKKVVQSSDAFGAIARGVADLWNYGAGDGQLSAWFYQRVTQLAYKKATAKKHHSEPDQVKDFVYKMNFDKLDYTKASDYFKKYKPTNAGACSCYRIDNKYYRAYDWKYDNCAEFIVKTENDGVRYATLGIAGGMTELTNEFVAENEESELYDIVPFMIVDGINEHGLVANVNVAPIDYGKTTGSNSSQSTAMSLCGLQVVRFILDHFASAKEACEYIRDFVNVYNPESLKYTLHYMVADANSTYIIEFYGNECVVKNVTLAPYMTNFFIAETVFNADGTVNTPYTEETPSANHISDHGAGLERYNLIVNNTESGDVLLNSLRYTNTYEHPNWFSEFVGIDDLTVNSLNEEFTPVYLKAKRLYETRLRNGKTWHTVHASVYDMDEKSLISVHQEDGEKIKTFLY